MHVSILDLVKIRLLVNNMTRNAQLFRTLNISTIIQIVHCFEGKYTRMFVPRFPGIPEMLYFPTPKAEGNITSRGFPGTEGQTFWYISREAMK